MQLEKQMEKLAQELSVPQGFPKESAQTYLVPIDEDQEVLVTDMQPGLLFFARLGSCPKREREAFFIRLMRHNLFGHGTQNAVLGLDEKAEMLTLSRMIKEDIDYKDFRDYLEDFLNQVDLWKSEIEEQKDSNPREYF